MSLFGRAEFLRSLFGKTPPPSPAASRPTSPGRSASLALNPKGGPALSVTVVEGPPPQRALSDIDPDDVRFTSQFTRIFAPVWQGDQSNWVCLDFAGAGDKLAVVAQKLIDHTTGDWVRSEATEKAFCVTALQDGFDAALVGLYDKARRRDSAVLSAMRMAWGTEPPAVDGRPVRPPPTIKATGTSIQLHAGREGAAVPLAVVAVDPTLKDDVPSDEDFGAALALERARGGRLQEEVDRLQRELDLARAALAAMPAPSVELADAHAELEEARVLLQRSSEASQLEAKRRASAESRASRAEEDLRRAKLAHAATSSTLEAVREERRQAVARARALEAEVEALRGVRASVSPAQLDAALRRTRAAEEDCARMSAIAGSEADKADVEAQRRAAAESEAEDLRQTIRDLRDKLDAAHSVSAQPVGQVEAMRREIEDLKRQLREGHAETSARVAVSPPPSQPGVRAASIASRAETSLIPGVTVSACDEEFAKAKRKAEAEAMAGAEVAKLSAWAALRVRLEVEGYASALACTSVYADFTTNPKLQMLVKLACQTWLPTYEDKESSLTLAASPKTVLSVHALSALFELKWDPEHFRNWLLDATYIETWKARFKAKETFERETKLFLAKVLDFDDVVKVERWLPRRGMNLMSEHYGFDVANAEAGRGPPVPPPGTKSERERRLHEHLYHCWYDLLGTADDKRNEFLLGDTGPHRDLKLSWIPPAFLHIPLQAGGKKKVALNWIWEQHNIS